ncbi:MAG: hypothetical protein JNL40_02250 [Cyclobacteriaceae bacterium]|nr:hypothetical protein [Cyclobacteriaceae bacterium]
MTLGQKEKASWDYYQEIERRFKSERYTVEEIDNYIQELIDDGSVPKPEIFIETDSGTKSRAVDYKTYKKYRQNNPIDLSRDYTIKLPVPDTAEREAQRNIILKALKGDTIN